MTAGSQLKRAQNRKWEDMLAFHLQTAGLYDRFVREHQHIPGRRFRLDFADPVNKVGIEVQGAVWSKARSGHNSGAGITKDCEKNNLSHLHGWRILMFTTTQVRDLKAIDFIKEFYQQQVGSDKNADNT